MKSLYNYIHTNSKPSSIVPKDSDDLRKIVAEELKRLGNDADLNHIDVSKLNAFRRTFWLKDFTGDISKWNMSNAVTIDSMFVGCYHFNGDLSEWDLSNCNTIQYMFTMCHRFEGIGLENWNVSKIEYFDHTFCSCKVFNANITEWKISSTAKDFSSMFENCENFVQDLSSWKIPNLSTRIDMFKNCPLARRKKLQPQKV